MTPLPDPLQADAKLSEMELHEPLAQRWAVANVHVLREGYAEAYRERVGVHPSRREELRTTLEAIRDERTCGEVTVGSVIRRLSIAGEADSDLSRTGGAAGE